MTEQRENSFFYGRKKELDMLLSKVAPLSDNSIQLAFVTGEAGSGKTALVSKFEEIVSGQMPDVIISKGKCNPLTGSASPYLPFRDLLNDLFGNFELRNNKLKSIKDDKLKKFFLFSAKCIVNNAPDLIGTFIPGGKILSKVGDSLIKETKMIDKINSLVEKDKLTQNLEESKIHEQYTNALRAVSKQYKIVLVIDDLQWADDASVSLLFYLIRHLENENIFLVGMYRSSEIYLYHHPMESVINELSRSFGEIIIDLEKIDINEKKSLVNGIIDTEANEFDDAFREILFDSTAGNILFVKELMQNLKENGHVLKNEKGVLYLADDINWSIIPSKLESVIKERIERLDETLKYILDIASVQGNSFIAQTISKTLNIKDIDIVRKLSKILDKKYNFITEREVQRLDGQLLSQYYFNNYIVQQYLFNDLSKSEKMLFSDAVANIIEEYYKDNLKDKAVELSHLYETAENWEKSIIYSMMAGDGAYKISAYQQAVSCYRSILNYLNYLPKSEENRVLELDALVKLSLSLKPIHGWSDSEVITCSKLAITIGKELKMPKKISPVIFGLWVNFLVMLQLKEAEEYAQEYKQQAEIANDTEMLLQSYIAVANTKYWTGDIDETLDYCDKFFSLFNIDKHGCLTDTYGQDPRVLMMYFFCLSLYLKGEEKQCLKYLDELITLAEGLEHPFSLAIALQTGAFVGFQMKDRSLLETYTKRFLCVSEKHNFIFYTGIAEMFQALLFSKNLTCYEATQLLDNAYYQKVLADGGLTLNSLYALIKAEIALDKKQYADIINIINKHACISLQHNEMCYYPEMLRLRGVAYYQMGDRITAEKDFNEALKIAKQKKIRAFELKLQEELER